MDAVHDAAKDAYDGAHGGKGGSSTSSSSSSARSLPDHVDTSNPSCRGIDDYQVSWVLAHEQETSPALRPYVLGTWLVAHAWLTIMQVLCSISAATLLLFVTRLPAFYHMCSSAALSSIIIPKNRQQP